MKYFIVSLLQSPVFSVTDKAYEHYDLNQVLGTFLHSVFFTI